MSTFATRLDPRRNCLNAIRLVLASMVIVSHSWIIGGYGAEPTLGGITMGRWAVDAFFVLSGYLITGSRLSNDLATFVQRRVLRIYPGFVVCLLTAVLIFAPIGYYRTHHSLHDYAQGGSHGRGDSPLNFLLANVTLKMNQFRISGTPTGPHAWTGSLWTLYYEFLCYLTVGLLACWGAFRRKPFIAMIAFVFSTVAYIEITHVRAYASSGDALTLLNLVPYFLAGTVVYQFRDKIPVTWWLAVLSALSIAVVPPLVGARYVVLLALPLTYLLLYVGAVVPIGLGRRNDISYGMYMYGYPMEQVLRWAHLGSQLLYIVLALVCTVPVAVASWFGVERPAMRWRTTPRNPQAPPEPAAIRPDDLAESTAPRDSRDATTAFALAASAPNTAISDDTSP